MIYKVKSWWKPPLVLFLPCALTDTESSAPETATCFAFHTSRRISAEEPKSDKEQLDFKTVLFWHWNEKDQKDRWRLRVGASCENPWQISLQLSSNWRKSFQRPSMDKVLKKKLLKVCTFHQLYHHWMNGRCCIFLRTIIGHIFNFCKI